MSETVILSGARTPIGKMSGGLASLSATELGARAIRAALERSGVTPEQVDYVFMGHVLLAGEGQATARQAAVGAGIPMTVPATTVNKVCLSGINAVYLAHQMIAAGDADIVVAGGMESMTKAPYLLTQAREGYRLGDGELVDSMMYDGLFCAFDRCAMGSGTEKYAASRGLAREPQDALAAQSHQRAAAAQAAGRFDDELVTVEVPQRRGDPLAVTADEGVRPDATAQSLGKLRAAFAEAGNITAGNASQISDGASALVLASRARAEALGLTPLGTYVGYGQVAGPDPSLLTQPSRAIRQALKSVARDVDAVDLFEINEAFAAVAVASMDDLGITDDVVNVNGGAIALGHPIGASGNRIVVSLLHELRRRGGGLGAAALCGGGGQGDALLVSV
ncbi:acetyl-CoA C-acyltransferase [Candidatus Poriferisocius sp.]|uniref:acetyl-CoA C-acyltransferase n=1 Tax=Candidatus Poriferisocius sp. TaxID=3101276 RepID=UPI003B5C0D03